MVRLIYGHRIDIEIYKDLLKDAGIEHLVRNEFEDAAKAGFGSGIPGNEEIFVDEENLQKATELIEAYKKTIQ